MIQRDQAVRSRPLVLIVDGHDDTRDLYMLGLTACDFEAMGASDTEHAYECLEHLRPDIIVTELMLDRHDGWDLIQTLKHETGTCDIPVVIVTADDARETRVRAECEGCASFLVKPCLPEALARELRRVLDGHVQMSDRH